MEVHPETPSGRSEQIEDVLSQERFAAEQVDQGGTIERQAVRLEDHLESDGSSEADQLREIRTQRWLAAIDVDDPEA